MMERLSVGAIALTVTLAIGGTGAPALAQSGLEQVERLTRLGRADDARDALMEWWDSDRENASRRELQRGLWLRGRLTVDPVQAELDFQRLAVLYPSGQFTPDAILRLAQASWAMGDDEASRRYMTTLRRDYPRSDARERGESWMEDAGPVPPQGDTPTRAAVDGSPADQSTDPVSAPRRDDPPVSPPPAEDPEADEPEGETDAEAAEPVMNYYVQLGAFAEEARAFALYEEVRAQDVDVRVVRVEGSRFTHVRVGRFAARSAAVELLEELTAQGISAALVRDDRAESEVRDQ